MKETIWEMAGYILTLKGNGEVRESDIYFLDQDRVKGLVPSCYYRSMLTHIFTYDLDGGFSLKELADRGEGLVNISIFIRILELCLYLKDQYFFELDSFCIHEDVILLDYNTDELSLVYSPVWRVPFLEAIIELVATFSQKEKWFKNYVERVKSYGAYLSLENYLGLLRNFEDKIDVPPEEEPIPEKKQKRSLFNFFIGLIEAKKLRELLVTGFLVLVGSIVTGVFL